MKGSSSNSTERAAPLRPAQWNRAPLPHVKRLIAIASGKGGVGKSTLAVSLAHACRAAGLHVGLMDADIHGPSVARMLSTEHAGQPEVKNGLIQPISAYDIRHLSMHHLAGGGAAIWRGAMVSKALQQMLRQTEWGSADAPLDALLIDMPPGTGDVHLTLAQQAPLDGAIIITTPQQIAVMDALKCTEMFLKINVPLLGVVENMSYLDGANGERLTPFGTGGGTLLAARYQTPLLSQLPLSPAIGAALDKGENPCSDGEWQAYFAPVIAAISDVTQVS